MADPEIVADMIKDVTARVVAKNPEVTDPKRIAQLVEQEFIYMNILATRRARNEADHKAFPGI